MHRILRHRVVPGVLAVMAMACGDDRHGPTALRPPLELEATVAALSLHPYGIGADRAPGAGCSASEYRQFDFWLGNWDVTVPGFGFSGTNVVERELDGCVVEENWTDGGRGRSLNFYDANTGTWRQHWVYSGGGGTSVLVLEGASPGPNAMSLAASRPLLNGSVQRDSIAWTVLSPDLVRQFWQISTNGGPYLTSFDGRYARVADVAHVPLTPSAVCMARAANHHFDFLLGEWAIRPGRGAGSEQSAEQSPRTSSVTTDLDYCLVEERVQGPGNYRGWSFSGYHPGGQQWHRTYVDNQGQAVVLRGRLENGVMVMRGTRRTPEGDEVMLRVTWEPDGADRVTQRWDFSTDGGATWGVELEVMMVRKP